MSVGPVSTPGGRLHDVELGMPLTADLSRSDLLLLDEPTNHLDLEAILRLEQYLARYPGSILLVSHDREFLNACVNRIAHVHDKTIDTYTGDYDDFERARAERIAQQNQAFERQQEKEDPAYQPKQ